MIDSRDLLAFFTGAAALKWWQWTTRRDRPRGDYQMMLARKNKKAAIARVLARYAAWRERVTGQRRLPGWEEDQARWLSERWPRMWL